MGTGASAMDRPDSWITTKVKTTLAGHRSVSAINTHVETNDGVVTLTGTARSDAERELAERYARDIEGVKDVRNEIKVSEKTDRASGSADRMSESNKEDKDQRGIGDKALDKLDDATITSRVKAALAGDRATSALRTEVDTTDGVVTLSGTATSEAEKSLAQRLAEGVKGVKSVDNRIEVK
jgi:osmotically-inducible protein OsmY